MLRAVQRGLTIAFVLTSMAWCRVSDASLVATSREVMVNTYTGGAQQNPSVAVDPDDGFLVVWEDNRFDNEGIHIRSRKFARDLEPVAADGQVDAPSDLWNRDPDVAALRDGGFIVVWRQGVFGGMLLARELAADGLPIGEEFRIDTAKSTGTDTPYLGAPSVAPAADGGFVVAWASGREKAPFGFVESDVYVRAFTAAGEPKGDDLLIDSPNATKSTAVDIRASGDGGFVLAWAAGPGNGSPRARVQTLDANALPVGAQLIDVGGPDPRVATSAGGKAYVVSSRTGFLEAPYDVRVFGRAFDGDSGGDSFALADRVSRGLSAPELAATTIENGDLVVAWTNGSPAWPFDGSDAGVYAQVFDADGNPLSNVRLVNVTTEYAQIDPELERFANDGVVAVWESDIDATTGGESGEVFVRTFEVQAPRCGDGTEDGEVTASDALVALQASVGAADCARCLCDTDDSGTTAATDALALLRTAVALATDLSCPSCPIGGGLGIDLAVDAECHGVHVEIPASALPANRDDLDCNVDPSVRALPCASSIRVEPDGLIFDARSAPSDATGCLLAARKLFSCHVDESVVEAMAETAVVTCGCGCAPECPSPRVCTSNGDGLTCSDPTSLRATPSSRARPVAALPSHVRRAEEAVTVTESVSMTSNVSTTSFSCGTCCFTPVVGEIQLSDPVDVTELRVRLQGDIDSTCLFCDTWGSDVTVDSDGNVEFCIFRQEGIQGPAVLASCFANDGSIAPGPAEVVRARGRNFEPIDAPTVVNDF